MRNQLLKPSVRRQRLDHPVNPCVLRRHHLPPDIDADLSWRATAIFTQQEVTTLLEAELPIQHLMVYRCAVYTGCRVGELIALKWGDLILEHKEPHPTDRLIISRSGEALTTKTQVARIVPIHSTLRHHLLAWRKVYAELYGTPPHPTAWLLPSSKGTQRRNSAPLQRLRKDLEHLGLRPRRFHDLRRTFITMLRGQGVHSGDVALLTHGPKKSMVDMYTTMPLSTLRGWVEKLPELESRPEPNHS